jgi:hypothetical protein
MVQNIVGGQDFKVKAGFMRDPNNTSQVIPIPGCPQTRKSPGDAAKTATTATALELMPVIRSQIITPNGVDRTLLATMNANAAGTQGRVVRAQITDVIEAKLRAESGGEVPQAEVERAAARFMPSNFDSDKGIEDKLSRMEKFLSKSLETSDPELFKRLTSEKAKPSGKVEASRAIDGKRFIKQNGQWFEVQ